VEVDLMGAGATVVVTGAGGLVGRACAARLAARGFVVRGLVRSLDPATALRPNFLPVGDLAACDDRTLRNALRDAHAVVHLAARVHRPHDPAPDAAGEYRRMNVELTQRLAQAALAGGVAHFVFASTVKVNGEATRRGRPYRESDPPDPHDDYARSKWAAEQVLAAVAEGTAMRATKLRIPLTYGPGVGANLAALARAIRRGVPLPFAAVANRRSILGVGNLCDAVAALLASDDAADRGRLARYFVADAVPVSTPDLVRAIAAAMNVPARLVAVPPGLLRFLGACAGRAAAVERVVGSLEVDTAAFCARFGWTPCVPLAQGMAEAFGGAAPL
jgi:nucleoside-diphosphate-sugar epimerase